MSRRQEQNTGTRDVRDAHRFDAVRLEGFSDVGWSVLTRLLLGSAITGAVCAALGWWLSIRWLQRAKP